MPITFLDAFTGGISAFFSVWQLCILQFSPFYAAFLIGVLSLCRMEKRASRGLPAAIAIIGLAAGFSLVYALMSSPGLGAWAIFHIKGMRVAAGVFIIITGLLMIVFALFGRPGGRTLLPALLSPVVGASLAVAYSPCISPALAKILSISSMPGGAGEGFRLLLFYGLGMCGSATAVVGVFMAVSGYIYKGPRAAVIVPVAASLFMMTIGFLLVADLMLLYKRFLVNLI